MSISTTGRHATCATGSSSRSRKGSLFATRVHRRPALARAQAHRGRAFAQAAILSRTPACIRCDRQANARSTISTPPRSTKRCRTGARAHALAKPARRGLDLYFERHDGGAATSTRWPPWTNPPGAISPSSCTGGAARHAASGRRLRCGRGEYAHPAPARQRPRSPAAHPAGSGLLRRQRPSHRHTPGSGRLPPRPHRVAPAHTRCSCAARPNRRRQPSCRPVGTGAVVSTMRRSSWRDWCRWRPTR